LIVAAVPRWFCFDLAPTAVWDLKSKGTSFLQETMSLSRVQDVMNDQADAGPHTNTGQTPAGTYLVIQGSDGAAPDARSAETSPM